VCCISRSRPLDIGQGDPAIQPPADGGDDIGIGDRRDVTIALQLLLVGIHRERYVDGEDELQVDRHIGRPGGG
jgi:hypothetical protein